jgi:hypothetical protein
MKIVFILLSVVLVMSLTMFVITMFGGSSKAYMWIVEREAYKNWEKVIENFESVKYSGHYTYPGGENAYLENYKFSVDVDGMEWTIYYWKQEKGIGVHGLPNGACLSDFDKYHGKIVKDMLCEKFDFMKEVMEQE